MTIVFSPDSRLVILPNVLRKPKNLPSWETMNERENVVVFDEYGPVRMIRTKEWKYIHRYPYGPHELYDLVNDPNETINLVDVKEKQDVKVSMKAMLDEWFFKYVNPELDGIHEAVTGKGQVQLAGLRSRGKPSFIE